MYMYIHIKWILFCMYVHFYLVVLVAYAMLLQLLVAAPALLGGPVVRSPLLPAPPLIVCGRPRRPDDGPRGMARRKPLTGFFVEKPEVIRVRTRIDEQLRAPDDDDDDYEPTLRNREPMNTRSAVHRVNWADPAYRNMTLAKRNATRAQRQAARIGGTAMPPPPPRTAAAERKAEALQLLHVNEAAWMQQRLATGEMQRLRLSDDDTRQQEQARRSAIAKERHRARRVAEAAADASTAAADATQDRGPKATGTTAAARAGTRGSGKVRSRRKNGPADDPEEYMASLRE